MLTTKLRLFIVLLIGTEVGTGVGCGRVEPADAGDVSRLALLDLSTAIQLVNDDRFCGFESARAIQTQQVIGELGAEGTVIRSVDGCIVDLTVDPEKYPYFACDASAGVARGAFRFSGSRSITGRLTGDDQNPVIPSSADALTISIANADFDGFEVARKDKAGSLSILAGSVSGTAHIGLVASAADGLCRVATPNAKLEDVRFKDARVRFTNLLKVRELSIASSLFEATNGAFGGEENHLAGSMTLDGIELAEPPLFDPEYTADAFAATYACPQGQAALPVTDQCGDINQFIAENTSRISFLAFVDLIALVSNDPQCGFASPAVVASAVAEGALGEEGALIYSVDRCTIELPEPTHLAPDCLKNSDVVSGRATISAKKTMRGTRTDDPARPILPRTDAPLTVEITAATLEDFSVTRGERSGLIASGSITGRMQPRIAQGTTRSFCSVGTPIASIEHVDLANATARLTTPTGIVTGATVHTDLNGINGAWRGKENAQWGSIAVNGQSFELPFASNEASNEKSAAFEPTYDPQTFAASWQCAGDLARPISFDCGAELPVPETVARMSIGIFGALVSFIENDASCGFASTSVRSAAQFTSATGDIGTATFVVPACRVAFTEPTVLAHDCNGKTITVQGVVTVHATKRMTGYNTGSLQRQVIPTMQDGTSFDATMDFEGFTYMENTPYAREPEIGVHIQSATLGGSVAPRLALDRTTGACSKPTPVSSFDKIGFKDEAEISILFPGLHFTTRVGTMSVVAQSGAKNNVVNSLSGSLVVGGQPYSFPLDGSAPLDPEYDPLVFARSFSCDADLVIPYSDQQCDFKDILALQTARYMPMVVQSVGTTVNNNGNCGLDVAGERLDPYARGPEHSITQASWRAPENGQGTCGYRLGSNNITSIDCRARRLMLSGNVDVAADLLVRGRVEEYRDHYYVNPLSPDAPTDYRLDIRSITNLRVAEVDPPNTVVQSLAIDSGAFDITFHPIMGYNASNDDPDFTFLVRTPINRISNIVYSAPSPGHISLTIGEMRFNARLQSASLSGFSGAYNGEANHIEGTVTIDGRAIRVNDALDPAYSQTDFDDRYRCTHDLLAVVPTMYP